MLGFVEFLGLATPQAPLPRRGPAAFRLKRRRPLDRPSRPGWLGRGELRQQDLMSRSRRAARWLQPGLVVKRWLVTSGMGLLIALLGAAIWADLQPIYWTLETVKWSLANVTRGLPRGITGPLVLLVEIGRAHV